MQLHRVEGPLQATVAYPRDWHELFDYVRRVRATRSDSALQRCLEVAGDAATVVFEEDYYDLDYRSEFALVHAREFAVPSPRTTRIHFFERRADWSQLLEAPEEFGYIGYMVLRSTQQGLVGRTMLRPPEQCDGQAITDSVRTAVTEHVTFFGRQVSVTAVPFLEQDGSLLTCAHATAWMAHYSAVLRKLVVRRPTADFALASGTLSDSRTYPSSGLTTSDTVHLLESMDLPPSSASISDLFDQTSARMKEDSVWLRPGFPSLATPSRRMREALSTELCRYLNSGLPCLLAFEDGEHGELHQTLICGYVRSGSPSGREVKDFVCHDDQRGPYLLLRVPDRVAKRRGERVARSARVTWPRSNTRDGLTRARQLPSASASQSRIPSPRAWFHIVSPLPRGIRCDASGAERAAAFVAETLLNELTEGFQLMSKTFTGRAVTSAEVRNLGHYVVSMRDALEIQLDAVNRREVSLRTYACSGTDFKIGYVYRCSTEGKAVHPDPRAVRIVQELPLPKFVWVTELLTRTIRDGDEGPPVIGEIILDASANPTDPDALLVHLPGAMIVRPGNMTWDGEWPVTDTDDGQTAEVEQSTRLRSIFESELYTLDRRTRYYTGRNSLKHSDVPVARGQWKGALGGPQGI